MVKSPKIIDHTFLYNLAGKARSRRATWSVSASTGKNHYVFSVLDPSTYIRPHCHPRVKRRGVDSSEFLIVLTGAISVAFHDAKTGKTKRKVLNAAHGERAVEIPTGIYHSYTALSPNTVILEVAQKGRKRRYLKGSPATETQF